MKINNEDYTKGNIVDLLRSNDTKKANFKTSFFDTLNKSAKKYESNTKEPTQKIDSMKNKWNNVTALDLNNLSEKGVKLISEFEKFLKSSPNEEDFSNILESIENILSENDNILEHTIEDIDTEKTLESLIGLFMNYNAVKPDVTPLLDEDYVSLENLSFDTNTQALEFKDNLFLSNTDQNNYLNIDNSNSVNSGNIITNENIITNKNIITNENIENIIDSTENEFLKLLDSFKDNDINADESKLVLKKILELSTNTKNIDSKSSDTFMKKEDIGINVNNLITGSIALGETNFKDSVTATRNPIVNQVIESIYAQLSKESLEGKTVELRLKLFPSKLGSVSVVIEKDNGSLNIKILSDNPEVRGLFLDSIQDLKFELSKNSLSNVNIDISNNNQGEQSEENKNKNNTNYSSSNDYIEDIAIKISTNNSIIDKILDIKI